MVELQQDKKNEAEPVLIAEESDTKAWNKLRTDTQNHTKRIKDLIALAQESRLRIDALLGRRTRARSDLDDNFTALPNVKRESITYDSDEHSRRGSRGSDVRRSSRDIIDNTRDQSERDRRGSRGQTVKENPQRETSEQIITHRNSIGVVEVGGVTLANKMMDTKVNVPGGKTVVQHQMMESKAAIKLNPSPTLARKPFKFGTISLQVKLDD